MRAPDPPKRTRGRPPVAAGEHSEHLQVTISSTTYAALKVRAERDRTTPQQWVRQTLAARLDDDDQ
jgi:hypothetical protein